MTAPSLSCAASTSRESESPRGWFLIGWPTNQTGSNAVDVARRATLPFVLALGTIKLMRFGEPCLSPIEDYIHHREGIIAPPFI